MKRRLLFWFLLLIDMLAVHRALARTVEIMPPPYHGYNGKVKNGPVSERQGPEIFLEWVDQGKIKIFGYQSDSRGSRAINFYINGRFRGALQTRGGPFSFELDRVCNGDRLKVSFLQYNSDGSHHVEEQLLVKKPEKGHLKSIFPLSDSPVISIGSLRKGKVTLYFRIPQKDSRPFKKLQRQRVNVYIDGKFHSQHHIDPRQKSINIDGLKAGEEITVKILDWKGPGNHYEESGLVCEHSYKLIPLVAVLVLAALRVVIT